MMSLYYIILHHIIQYYHTYHMVSFILYQSISYCMILLRSLEKLELFQPNPLDPLGSECPGDLLLPVALGALRTAVHISANRFHVCAVLDDGSAKCWGRNNHGQLGSVLPNGGVPNTKGFYLYHMFLLFVITVLYCFWTMVFLCFPEIFAEGQGSNVHGQDKTTKTMLVRVRCRWVICCLLSIWANQLKRSQLANITPARFCWMALSSAGVQTLRANWDAWVSLAGFRTSTRI